MYPNFALALLLNKNREVLLARRINTPFCNNCYALPGGKIEYGETATQAVIREVLNSLSIIVQQEALELMHTMYRKCNEPEFFSCTFKVNNWEGELCNNEPERHDDMRWFPLNELPSTMVPAHKQAIELILENVNYSEHGWHKP
jgi:8-oxo-dGTP diphosphatase